jgi:ArsR family transcriptional regulator
MAEQDALGLVSLFKLLADETRLHVLYYLTQCPELNVGALCRLLQQSQPAVSHHLALLKGAGLIEMRRAGKHNYYRVVPHKIRQQLDTLFAALPSR